MTGILLSMKRIWCRFDMPATNNRKTTVTASWLPVGFWWHAN